MGVARAQAARYRILVGLLTGLTLFTVILYLGATQRDHISHLVPTVSWENVVGQAETAQLPQCSGEGSIHELERKWGKAALRMSLAHGGSGARLHRALRRFKESKKIVSVPTVYSIFSVPPSFRVTDRL